MALTKEQLSDLIARKTLQLSGSGFPDISKFQKTIKDGKVNEIYIVSE